MSSKISKSEKQGLRHCYRFESTKETQKLTMTWGPQLDVGIQTGHMKKW